MCAVRLGVVYRGSSTPLNFVLGEQIIFHAGGKMRNLRPRAKLISSHYTCLSARKMKSMRYATCLQFSSQPNEQCYQPTFDTRSLIAIKRIWLESRPFKTSQAAKQKLMRLQYHDSRDGTRSQMLGSMAIIC